MSYIGKEPTVGNFQKCDAISVVNGQATYALTVGGSAVFPESSNHVLCSLNGILQAPTDSFTISSSNIVFASNLSTGDVIDFVMILGSVLDLGVPSDNTVSLAKLTATGTKDATTFLRGDNTFASAQGAYESQLLHVRDEKSANTGGGAFTSGSWQTRTLNTVMTNEISGASLSSNQITLPSGTYFIYANAHGYTVNVNKLKWYNTSDSSDVLIGNQGRSDSASADITPVWVIGRFTISAQKTFELQHRCETTRSDANGFGVAANFGVVEVYADVQLWKVA